MSASRHRRWGIAPLRPHALGAAIVSLLALLIATPALDSASAAPLRTCTPTHGTIVVVDFAHWGGPIVRGCGVGERTGYALLHDTGFTTAGDQHDGPAVVCRIGDAAFHHGTLYPTPRQDNCVQTPPTTGYWAYFVAPRGTNHWAYSPLGAMGDVPRPGEVELWIFGATNVAGTHGTGVPTFSPATLRARPARHTRTSTTARHTPTSTIAGRTATGATRATHTATTTTRATHTTATTATTMTSRIHTTSTPTTTTTTPPTETTTTHRGASPPAHPRRHHHRRAGAHHHPHHGAPRHHTVTSSQATATTRVGGAEVVAARPTSRRASAGSATPLIVGVALAVLLCAGAGRAIRLRRREE
jgi:hypothetical protein